MKKILVAVVLVVLVALSGQVWAASSMVATPFSRSDRGATQVIKLVCTAHTDGTFTAKQITAAEIGFNYWEASYYLLDMWAVTNATDDHTNAAAVTIYDETGRYLVGSAVGDTLALSQTASTATYLSATRSAGQRHVSSKLTVAIADTGGSATVQTIYIVLGK
jgi:hypothetical protein